MLGRMELVDPWQDHAREVVEIISGGSVFGHTHLQTLKCFPNSSPTKYQHAIEHGTTVYI